jgi:Domain of unknown function (DUF3330)
MEPKPKPEEPLTVPCEVCLKEIPRSEAVNAEATDYVVHFCGLDCYRTWAASSADRPPAPERKP